ncbi:hypothetical protein ABPG77_000768 [Micractinium sp. CCAP 211/92]
MAGTSAASAARRAGGQASLQRTSVPGAKTSGTQQTPAEPLPAYTSLARQQLQQRLKAAIAAGTRSASTAVAAHVAQPSGQPSRAGRKAAGRHPQKTQAPRLVHSLRLSLGPAGSCASAAVLAQQQALSGHGVPDTLPVPSPASLEDGFQLLLPGSAGRIGIAGSDQKPQPASPVQSGVGPRQQHLPLTTASSAQPHWLGAHLLRQRLYMAAPECPGQRQHAQRGVQRGLLALRMPPLTSRFADLMPVRAGDAAGTPCLLVLPSEGPSSRQEAEAALAALQQLLADPAAAAPRAAAWRQQLLLSSSAAALLGLTADYAPVRHDQQLRSAQPRQYGANGELLAGPAWLAAGSGGGAGLVQTPAGKLGDAVQGVRSSSEFLKSSSHPSCGGSASPLPPLAPSKTSSLLCFAPLGVDGKGGPEGARGQGAGHCGLALPSTCSVLCPKSSPPAGAALAAGSAQCAAALPPVPPPPPLSDPAWDSYCCASLAAGLAACMAEAVRQVEVGCAERGCLLAQLWNSYTGVLESTIQQQQAQVEVLASANANLAAEASQLRWEGSTMSFLRTEIGRLRIDKETVTLELEDCRKELAAVRRAKGEADEERQAFEAHLRRRVAVLRWQYAGTAVLTSDFRTCKQRRRPQSVAKDELASSFPRQTAELEYLAGAAVQAQHQLEQWRQRKQAEAALAAALSTPAAAAVGGSNPRTRHASRLQHSSSAETDKPPQEKQASLVGALSSSGAGSGRGAGGSISFGPGSSAVGGALGALRCLRPEARAALVLGQPAEQRRHLLAAMPDAERAGIVVLLEESARLQLYDELGSALALSTDAFIGRKPLLLAKLLATQPLEQAAARFGSQLMQQQQVAVLQAATHQLAAELLAAQPEAAQRKLLLGMLPGAAAGLLHWLMPARALQLVLGGVSGPACSTALAAGAPKDGSAGSWVTEVLQHLNDCHLSAMLAAAQPGDVATLLEQPSEALRQRMLGLLCPGPKAAALAVAHQRRVAAARRHKPAAEAVAAAAPAVEGRDGEASAAPGAPLPAPLPAGNSLDAGCALLAHFQLLTVAEKTSLLLMGSPEAAALLLPLLGGAETEDVLLLLPKQRQEQLLQLQHPEEERRLQGLALQSRQRRGSLLLPQQVAPAPAGTGPGAGSERRPSSPSPRELAAAVPESAAEGGPRRSSLAAQQLAGAAAAASTGPAGTRGRSSFLACQQLPASSGGAGALRGRRRSTLLSAQQQAAAAAAGRGARLTSSIVTAAQGFVRRGSLSAASPRGASAAAAAAAAGATAEEPG